ncbi:polyprenyl diphosphate synthase [Candidatus Symbiobacter mobilis]|uniref:Isoprenyl transferase n=1 Tax=Candidatus Symbiobacter mobilis CR TaxID=946483 RepID=U5N794_9BURK|nr:polyprenyl diphosphate synthase [Candidatus Symbiobacter mobilis]AGX86168.1 undecaprenyl diphosphate synthase [Candidatus Symbiobacter mobilis CR]
MAATSSPPTHVAIVMDGNGRWASRRFLPRVAGHKQGVESLQRCARACAQRGIAVLTVFAFSSENWRRPAEEVSGLMDLFTYALGREVDQLCKEEVRLRFLGDRSGLPDRVVQSIVDAESRTAAYTALQLNVCFNYGGRWDIVQAARSLQERGVPITESTLQEALSLSHVPDPDLVIRTGGEQRISNFLLWQSAYSELYFSDKLWPDFDERELDNALLTYAQRQRRFGKTPLQAIVDSPRLAPESAGDAP